MKSNVGSIDKTIRIIAGVVIIGLGVYYQSWWGAVGAVPLLTAFIRWCPAYAVFGTSTCGLSCGCSNGKNTHTA